MKRLLGAVLVAGAALLSMPHGTALAGDPAAQALDLFERGKAAYQAGRFQEAIDLLAKAHALKPEPVLLYNLARAYEGAGDAHAAIAAYQRYLREAADVPDRAAIEQRIAGLEATLADKARLAREREGAKTSGAQTDAAKSDGAKPDGARPDGSDEPPPSRGPSVVPWVVAGVGGVGVLAGAVVGIMALGKHDDADAAPSQREAVDEQARAEDLGVASTVALVVGGALCAGGVGWGIVDVMGSSSRTGRAGVRLAVGPRVVLHGRFH